MRAVARFLAALLVATAVMAVGLVLFNALEIEGLARLGLVLLAAIAGSLVDRERFYGPRSPQPRV